MAIARDLDDEAEYTSLEAPMTEGPGAEINPQAESTLDQMARGMTEKTGRAGQANASARPAEGTEGNVQTDVEGNIQRSTQEGDTHSQIEGKINEMAADITEGTGGHGDIHLHTQRKMNEMAQKMFEED
jgi:hypothetical protein